MDILEWVKRINEENMDSQEFNKLDDNYRVFTHVRSGLVELETRCATDIKMDDVKLVFSTTVSPSHVLRLRCFLDKWDEFRDTKHFDSEEEAIALLNSLLAVVSFSVNK